jgi:membrane fusion protein (multidrug efflux system)
LQTFTSFRTVRIAGLRWAPLLAVFLLLSACGQEEAANAQPPAPLPQVGFRTLHPQTVTLTTQLPGRTVAFRRAEVRPQVDGIIQKRLFEQGAAVEAGQQLYQIDPATYQAAVKAAEAELARAQASLQSSTAQANRYRELLSRKVVSQQEYDVVFAAQAEDEADVAAAEARLERARINLNYTMVTAPIGGRIGRSNITEGALVTANQETPLATITQLDPIYVDMTQPSTELLRTRRAIETGEITMSDMGEVPVELIIDATGTNYPHTGRVQFSEVLVNETTGTVSLRAVFPNPENELMPGLFVRGVVSQGEVKNAFKVPQAAVVRGNDGQAFVWLIGSDDTIKRQPVAIQRAVGDAWLVTGGLSDGDRIVVDGLQRVKPDSKVTPVAIEQPDTPDATKQTGASS